MLTRAGACRSLGVNVPTDAPLPPSLKDIVNTLHRYYLGQVVAFNDNFDLPLSTNFERRVWSATSLIPYGEVRSYSWIAAQIGAPRAARAVGNALGRNPLPIIIPCHRVVAKNGLGGFAGGLRIKRRLLKLERANIPMEG